MDNKILTWRHDFTSNRLFIKEGKTVVGGIKWPSSFKAKALGAFDGKQYILNRNGVFSVTADIREYQSDELLEEVKLNVWRSRGKVLNRPGEDILWKYHSFFHQEWVWKNGLQTEIKYIKKVSVLSEKGVIILHERFDPRFYYRVLLGFYIRQYFQ